jgi:hypothetical protein
MKKTIRIFVVASLLVTWSCKKELTPEENLMLSLQKNADAPKTKVTFDKMVHNFGLAQFTNPRLTDRTKINFTLMAIVLVQGMAILGEVNSMTEEQKADIRAFIAHFSHITEQIQTELKWDKPTSKKRK